MKIISINSIECQLIGDQAYLYTEDGDSEVFNIKGIEFAENAEDIIISELEALNSSSFLKSITLF